MCHAQNKLKTIEEVCAGAKRITILENVMNPTNIGAIFRSAAALGMDAVLMDTGVQQSTIQTCHKGKYGNCVSNSLDFF